VEGKRRSVQVVFVELDYRDSLNELHIIDPNLRHSQSMG